MKKIFIVVLFISLSSSFASGQLLGLFKNKKVKKEIKDNDKGSRFSKGGNISFGFAPLNLEFSPNIYYKISPKFSIGAGGVLMYNRVKEAGSVQHLYVYGGRVQLIPHLTKHIYIQAEYEGLNVNNQETVEDKTDRTWLHNPILGAGFMYPIWKKLVFNMSLSYNFNYKEDNSPFPSPWRFRIGFNL